MRNILTGGGGINTSTVVHFYTIHSYVLSIAAIALAVVHLVALVIQEQEQKSILLQQLEKLIAPLSSLSPSTKVKNVGS